MSTNRRESLQDDGHWLLLTPVEYLNQSTATDSDQAYNTRSVFLTYDKLNLHLFFFIEDSLVLFRPQINISSNDKKLLCVPCETVDTVHDDNDKIMSQLNAQDWVIRDVVLDFLQPEIQSGALQGIQFMDFAHPEPVTLKKGRDTARRGSFEHQDIDIAVMLSLSAESKPYLALNRTMTFARPSRSPVYFKAEKELQDHIDLFSTIDDGEVSSFLDQNVADLVFTRQGKCGKDCIVPKNHPDKIGFLSQFCTRNLNAIVTAWKKYTTQERFDPMVGFVAFERGGKENGVYIFLPKREDDGKFKAKEEMSYDRRDGRGVVVYDIIGRFANMSDKISLTTPKEEDFLAMIDEDGRFKVQFVDLRGY